LPTIEEELDIEIETAEEILDRQVELTNPITAKKAVQKLLNKR
jgi:hypothetical protein